MATDKPRFRKHADGSVSRYTSDGLVNMVSGMGTARDKAGQAQYYTANLTEAELLAAYTASKLVQRVVDMPAEDACREWREWGAEDADISMIEAEEKRLNVQGKVMRAMKLARLFGGCALLIGDGSNNPAMPLNPERIGKGGLKYLTLLTMRDLSSGMRNDDLTSEEFGKPLYWNINAVGNAGIRVHPSRLVLFHGSEPMGDYDVTGHYEWGGSALLGGLDTLKRVEEVAANINSLTYEAKVDVIKIPDLMQNLATRGDAYSTEIIRRLTLAATGKGINGTLILDALEEYEQKSASFGTLDTILDRFMQLACAAYGIPMTLLFGMSPGGMNATGASDTRGYYDRVKVIQTLGIEPAMRVLDECLIRSALGDRPEDVHYNWKPLWQATALERAQIGKTLVEAMVALDGMEVIPAEAIGKAAVNALTECGAFPGLEAAVEEYGGVEEAGAAAAEETMAGGAGEDTVAGGDNTSD